MNLSRRFILLITYLCFLMSGVLSAQANNQADLVIEAIRFEPLQICDALLAVEVDVANIGAAAAEEDFTIGFYIENEHYNLSYLRPTRLGEINTGNFPAGFRAESVQTQLELPHFILPDDGFILKAVIDDSELVAESDETNNEIEETFSIEFSENINGQLDIIDIQYPDAFPIIGEQLSYSVRIRNNGDATIENRTLVLRQEIYPWDTGLPWRLYNIYGTTKIPSLAPNEEVNIDISADWEFTNRSNPNYYAAFLDGYALSIDDFKTPHFTISCQEEIFDFDIYENKYTTDLAIEFGEVNQDGGYVEYEVKVSNLGNETAYNVIAKLARHYFGTTPEYELPEEVIVGFNQGYDASPGSSAYDEGPYAFIPKIEIGETLTIKLSGNIELSYELEYPLWVGSGHLIDTNLENNKQSLPDVTETPKLQLSLTTNESNPNIYKNLSLTATIENTGDASATDILVQLSACSALRELPGLFNSELGLVYANTNSVVSKGTYSNLFQNWTIPSLTAGESATLTINLFTLTEEEVNILAQVREEGEDAHESCVAMGEDEALLSLNADEERSVTSAYISGVSLSNGELVFHQLKEYSSYLDRENYLIVKSAEGEVLRTTKIADNIFGTSYPRSELIADCDGNFYLFKNEYTPTQLIKYDANLNILYSKIFNDFTIKSMAVLPNSDILLGGGDDFTTVDDNLVDNRSLLLLWDKNGNQKQQFEYDIFPPTGPSGSSCSGAEAERIEQIKVLADKSLFLEVRASGDACRSFTYAVKLNENREVQWTKEFMGNFDSGRGENTYIHPLIPTTDGGFVVVSSTGSLGYLFRKRMSYYDESGNFLHSIASGSADRTGNTAPEEFEDPLLRAQDYYSLNNGGIMGIEPYNSGENIRVTQVDNPSNGTSRIVAELDASDFPNFVTTDGKSVNISFDNAGTPSCTISEDTRFAALAASNICDDDNNGNGEGNIDLELSLAASNTLPGRFGNISSTLTVQNKGTAAATDIKINLLACNLEFGNTQTFNGQTGVVYAGTDPSVSLGTYKKLTQEWTIPSLAAGASATLTVHLFTLTDEEINLIGRVIEANESDADSTPNYSSDCFITEDDEAFLRLNEFEDNDNFPDLQLSNLRVANVGEQNTTVPYQIDISNNGIGDASADFRIGIYLSNDNQLSNDDRELGEIPTGNFHAGLTIRNVNGNFDLTGVPAGDYYLILEVDTDKIITESDEQNNTISTAFRVTGGTTPPREFVCEDNILRNNGFEDGLTFWNNTFGDVQISSDARTGNALELCEGNGQSVVQANVPIVEGAEAYTLFYYAKVDTPADAETIFGNQVNLFFFDASWRRLAGLRLDGTPYTTRVKSSTTYSLHSTTKLVPENAAYVGIEIIRRWEGCMYVDDLCLIPETTATNCNLDLEIVGTTCDDNDTPENQLDDLFTFDYRVNATDGSLGGYTITYPTRVNSSAFKTGYYGEVYTSVPLQLGVTYDITASVKDMISEGCTSNVIVEKPEACSEALACDIDMEVSTSACNDNGTPENPDDDTFTITILATGINTAEQWELSIYPRTFSGPYNTPVEIGPFSLTNNRIDRIGIRDMDDPGCYVYKDVEVPLPCATPSSNSCMDNLSQNADFEQDLSQWEVATYETYRNGIVSSIVGVESSFDGSKAAEVCTNSNIGLFQSAIKQTIPIDSTKIQAFELAYDAIIMNRGGGGAWIFPCFYDVNGEFISGDNFNTGVDYQWSRNQRTIRFAPSNAVQMEVNMGASERGYGDACVRYDNICLRKIGNEFDRITCENNLLTDNWSMRDVNTRFGGPINNIRAVSVGVNGSYAQAVQAFEGQIFELKFYANFRGNGARVYLDFLDENGALLDVSSISDNQGLWDGYTLQSNPAPAGTQQIQVRADNDMWLQAPCLNRIGGVNTDVDLSIAAVETPFSVRMNTPFEYSIDLVNDGAASVTGSYNIEVYVAPSRYFNSSSATYIGSISTTNTPVGTTNLLGVFNMPNINRAGRQYLHFFVDEENAIAELNEEDNQFVQEIGVTASGVSPCNNRSNSPWEEWISYIKIGETENLTDKTEYSIFYSNPVIEAQKGVSIPIQLRATYSYFTHPEHWRIWIDLNQDNTYTENEIVYQGILQPPAAGNGISKTLYDNMTIPNSALNGRTRLRIIMSRTGFEDPCGIIEYGEIEDYYINISGSNQQFSLEENKPTTSLHLYPNPTRDALQVVFEANSDKTDVLRIFNAQGMLQLEQAFEVTKGQNQLMLGVSDLAAGVYFLTTAGGQKTRFVKIE